MLENSWNNHEDTYEEAIRREMLKLKEENYNLKLDLKELTKVFYKLLGDKNIKKEDK